MADAAKWIMIAEKRYNRLKLHVANESFVTMCGRDNMLVGDYVEFQEGNLNKIGENRQVLETVPEWKICKLCLTVLKKQTDL